MCALAAVDAEAAFCGPFGWRRIPVLAAAVSPGQSACAAHELLTGFEVPCQLARGSFHKVGLRNAQAIAVASVPVVGMTGDDGRIARLAIACGSVAPRVVRATSVETALLAMPAHPDRIAAASHILLRDISPISDIRGSAAYRQGATVGILRRALQEVLSCA